MTVLTYVHLARAQHGLGESKEALASARKAIAMAESFVEPGSPSYLIGHGRLAEGDVLQALGSTADAQASYRRALEHLERTLGPRHEATEAARRAVR